VTGILSKYELDYLTGKVQLDGKEAINARYRIKKKVESLQQLIPLLEKHGFSIDNQLEMSSLAKTDQALLRVIPLSQVRIYRSDTPKKFILSYGLDASVHDYNRSI